MEKVALADIDRRKVRVALIRARGRIPKAAEILNVRRLDLQALIDREPALMEYALEILERRLDRAERVIKQAMREGTSMKDRLTAAAYIVRRRLNPR